MNTSRIILLAILGGILGFGIHLIWHSSAGISVFSAGPHAVQGTIYTLAGVGAGVLFYLITSRR